MIGCAEPGRNRTRTFGSFYPTSKKGEVVRNPCSAGTYCTYPTLPTFFGKIRYAFFSKSQPTTDPGGFELYLVFLVTPLKGAVGRVGAISASLAGVSGHRTFFKKTQKVR
jgi:hypothetical protein